LSETFAANTGARKTATVAPVDGSSKLASGPPQHHNDGVLKAPFRRNDDEILVKRILGGDDVAFEILVTRYHPRLFQVVLGILGDHQRSEDACQEIFVKAYLKLESFRHQSQLSTWLYRIAINTALKLRGKVARHREVLVENVADAAGIDRLGSDRGGRVAGSPGNGRRSRVEDRLGFEDERVRDIECNEQLEKLLRPLPPHLRTVVILREREGMSYREIAEVLECTPGAIEQRLYRAFCTLREVWQPRGRDLGIEERTGGADKS